MFNEFKEFLLKTNAMALAVGVIIGAAAGKIVSALVADILMPIISLALPAGDWREASFVLVANADPKLVKAIKYGDFLGSVIDFVFIALAVFLIMKMLIKPAPPAPETPSKGCPFCKESNAVDATKCKACTSEI